MPDISVILPVYNGEKYLEQSIKSVLSQVQVNFKLLILDNCSTDETPNILNKFNDTRISIFRNDVKQGLFYNLNFLIKNCDTDLIKIWTHDDLMDNNALSDIISFHQKNGGLGFSYCAVQYIDENGAPILKIPKKDNTPSIVDRDLHAKICFYTGSIAANIASVTLVREAINKVGFFNESMTMSGDFDMWVRIAEHFKIGFINKPIIILRDHTGQLSQQEQYYVKVLREDSEVYKYLFNYLPAPLKKYGRKQLRNHKLVFYYTLMLKSFFKGKVRTGVKFWQAINNLDYTPLVFIYFLKNKILKPNFYRQKYQDNKWLISN